MYIIGNSQETEEEAQRARGQFPVTCLDVDTIHINLESFPFTNLGHSLVNPLKALNLNVITCQIKTIKTHQCLKNYLFSNPSRNTTLSLRACCYDHESCVILCVRSIQRVRKSMWLSIEKLPHGSIYLPAGLNSCATCSQATGTGWLTHSFPAFFCTRASPVTNKSLVFSSSTAGSSCSASFLLQVSLHQEPWCLRAGSDWHPFSSFGCWSEISADYGNELQKPFPGCPQKAAVLERQELSFFLALF